jgi:hypothetical protein
MNSTYILDSVAAAQQEQEQLIVEAEIRQI